MKNDRVYLQQIEEAVDKINDFVSGLNYKQFLADQKTQSAVIMQLVLIGELAKKVTKETQTKIPLPWKDIAGFRDRAIHDYYQIDLEIVWKTVSDDLPLLKRVVRESLEK